VTAVFDFATGLSRTQDSVVLKTILKFLNAPLSKVTGPRGVRLKPGAVREGRLHALGAPRFSPYHALRTRRYGEPSTPLCCSLRLSQLDGESIDCSTITYEFFAAD
jgi:hypothetical protein